MQVRYASPPLLPLPFDDFLLNFSPTIDNSIFLELLLGQQLDPGDGNLDDRATVSETS